MIFTIRTASAVALTALATACAATAPPSTTPTQVQVSFNLTPQDSAASSKHIARGAISGVPQHVGFYYSVNPDCTSDGLVQTQLKSPPAHGTVSFAKADGYTNFPVSSTGHACNSKKSPGVEIVYTSAEDFAGTDQFTVQGVGPHGKYMETAYTVTVIAKNAQARRLD
jgi:hypothetical protein